MENGFKRAGATHHIHPTPQILTYRHGKTGIAG